jgi:hypothetical protein
MNWNTRNCQWSPAPVLKPFDETLTGLTLYVSAKEIYQRLDPAWLACSVNPTEGWEKLARRVIPGDYFQQKYRDSHHQAK